MPWFISKFHHFTFGTVPRYKRDNENFCTHKFWLRPFYCCSMGPINHSCSNRSVVRAHKKKLAAEKLAKEKGVQPVEVKDREGGNMTLGVGEVKVENVAN